MTDDLKPAHLLGRRERTARRWKTGRSAGPRLLPQVERLHAGELAIHPDLRSRIRQPRHKAARHVIEQVGRSSALLDPPSEPGTGPRPDVVRGPMPVQRAGLFDLRSRSQAVPGPAGPLAPFGAAAPQPRPPSPELRPPQPAGPQSPRATNPESRHHRPPEPPPSAAASDPSGLFDPFDGLVEIVDAGQAKLRK